MNNSVLKNVSVYLGIYDPPASKDFFSKRRNLLYARILVMTGVVSFLNFLKDLIDQGFTPIPAMGFLCFLSIAIAFFLNRKGKTVASRVLFLFLLNALIAIMCSVIPPDRIAFVYFFPLITVAYVVFDDSQNTWRWFFVLLPLTLLVALIANDFKLFGNYQLSVSEHGQRNMIINQVAAALMIALCFDFIIKTNSKSEQLLHSYADDASRKKEDLEKTNGELDRFVYSASHDLRAPLLSIQGLVKVALAEEPGADYTKYFEMIGDRVAKLDEFIKEIIEYSRNARTEINYEEVDIKALSEEVIAHLQYLEGTEQIEIYISSPIQTVKLDKGRTKIILSNILANAIKYHNLRQDNPWIELKIELSEHSCILKITDNGSGIPPEKQERIFDMFFRATDRSGGSGLGLFIVKEAVMKLDGKISVKSEYGKGSEFVVTLPLQKS
jgi:signal transduction histidine kinase